MNIFKRFLYNFKLGLDELYFCFLIKDITPVFFTSLTSDLDRKFWNYPEDYFLNNKLKKFGFNHKIIKIEYPFTFLSKGEDNLYLMITSDDYKTTVEVMKEDISIDDSIDDVPEDFWETLFIYSKVGVVVRKNSDVIEIIDEISEDLKDFLKKYHQQKNN